MHREAEKQQFSEACGISALRALCFFRGRSDACPAPYLPAQDIEDLVVNEIRQLARDPELARAVYQEASQQQQAFIPKLQAERQRLTRRRQAKSEQVQRLVAMLTSTDAPQPSVSEKLAELEGVVEKISSRTTQIDAELTSLEQNHIDHNEVAKALAQFDALWEVLYPQEQARIVRSLIGTVTHQESGDIRIAVIPLSTRDRRLKDTTAPHRSERHDRSTGQRPQCLTRHHS